jgi:O-acetyl-ADP-ribose deacetylase (regulator of RNase III)
MIRYVQGNLLEAPADALVNAVNTVGVMGKGIALMFKLRFDENYRRYVAACKTGQVRTGLMFVTEVNELVGPRWIVNFPTKQHWRAPSRMDWIVDGLQDLRRFIVDNNVRSIAVPALGAGNGGLDWPAVRQQIERTLGDLDADVMVYEPMTTNSSILQRVHHQTEANRGGS